MYDNDLKHIDFYLLKPRLAAEITKAFEVCVTNLRKPPNGENI